MSNSSKPWSNLRQILWAIGALGFLILAYGLFLVFFLQGGFGPGSQTSPPGAAELIGALLFSIPCIYYIVVAHRPWTQTLWVLGVVIHGLAYIAIFVGLRRGANWAWSALPLFVIGLVTWILHARRNTSAERPLTLIKPPFPPLTKDVFGGDLFHWRGTVHFKSWEGFAAEEDLSSDGWSPEDPGAVGELSLFIHPIERAAGGEPTEEQAKAFQHLLDNERLLRDIVLEGIFKEYPEWRASFYGGTISHDGGKTFRPASDFPDLFPPDKMPEISQPADLMRLIRPQGIHILKEPKDGYTEVGFSFQCKWDEEHGLGVLTHKGKVIH